MIKIMHVITDLSPGGAETMLFRLLSEMDTSQFENEVVSLTSCGTVAESLRAKGIRVRALGMSSVVPNPICVLQLSQWIRKAKPQIVHTWMYHANFVGSVAARLVGDTPIVWGIHHANLSPEVNKPRTIWTAKACAWMSARTPNCVLFCSASALELHARLGYAAQRMQVIPNGFDLGALRPAPLAALALRRELSIPDDAPLIGMAARFHPLKDHKNFIQAAGLLHTTSREVHFVLCGNGVTRGNPELTDWVAAAGIFDCCHLLGERQDLPRLLAAMDIATSSSRGEAFPLAIGEAMACGTPCVVTDVGDSAAMVGDTGRIVPPQRPAALAAAWQDLLNAGPEKRRRLGVLARRRIEQRFALATVVDAYESTYRQLLGKTGESLPSRRTSPCDELLPEGHASYTVSKR